jgi:hypothetical protein
MVLNLNVLLDGSAMYELLVTIEIHRTYICWHNTRTQPFNFQGTGACLVAQGKSCIKCAYAWSLTKQANNEQKQNVVMLFVMK